MNAPVRETPEFGPVFGIVTPMANTTVEPEMSALLPGTMLAARAVSRSPDSRQRLIDYIGAIPAAIESFDTAPLAGVGFACTCGYLLAHDQDAAGAARLSDRFGVPVHTALTAIRAVFADRGVSSFAWVTPYPAWLREAGVAWWAAHGVRVTATVGLPVDLTDTRGIYRLTTPRVAEMTASLDRSGADVVLFGGTGMPTLPLMAGRADDRRWLGSNIALAAALVAGDGPIGPAIDRLMATDAPWRARMGRA